MGLTPMRRNKISKESEPGFLLGEREDQVFNVSINIEFLDSVRWLKDGLFAKVKYPGGQK